MPVGAGQAPRGLSPESWKEGAAAERLWVAVGLSTPAFEQTCPVVVQGGPPNRTALL